MTQDQDKSKESRKQKPGRPPSQIKKKRVSFYLPRILADRLSDYAYQEGMPVTVALSRILLEFFKDREIARRPIESDLAEGLKKLSEGT